MNTKPIPQHYWNNTIIKPAKPADKPRNEQKQQSFLSILKRQSSEDVPTFIITRLTGILLIFNIVNQVHKCLGWW